MQETHTEIYDKENIQFMVILFLTNNFTLKQRKVPDKNYSLQKQISKDVYRIMSRRKIPAQKVSKYLCKNHINTCRVHVFQWI